MTRLRASASARPHAAPDRSRFGEAGCRALIVGGGIGGLATAIALSRAGFEVQVLERAPDIREVGAGISLWANAIRALDRLGVRAAIDRQVWPTRRPACAALTAAVVAAISAESFIGCSAFPSSSCTGPISSPRSSPRSLRRRFRIGADCTGIAERGDRVEVEIADGRRVKADLVVGADGLRSVVRAALHGSEKPRYSGCSGLAGGRAIRCLPRAGVRDVGRRQPVRPGAHQRQSRLLVRSDERAGGRAIGRRESRAARGVRLVAFPDRGINRRGRQHHHPPERHLRSTSAEDVGQGARDAGRRRGPSDDTVPRAGCVSGSGGRRSARDAVWRTRATSSPACESTSGSAFRAPTPSLRDRVPLDGSRGCAIQCWRRFETAC